MLPINSEQTTLDTFIILSAARVDIYPAVLHGNITLALFLFLKRNKYYNVKQKLNVG